ncbi:hypothetical protein HPB51_019506 [Rhipicephalus microplus]|uniref:Nuclease HARBI1 n=1 Tax=Rhipicephalus microplus TaxID=6941 RepID=A0A9J6EB89_RHIMP|nr:hypothetical protein HPB51_019506 [Rhipicephalus microplus]
MAAAKRAWCSGSNDFNVVAADSGSERPPCLPSDSRMAEAAKRRRLAEVFDELDDVSSDSCWSSTSESSSSSSDDDDEVYAAAFQQLFSLPERRPKVEAYVTKTFKRNFRVTRPVVDFLAAEFAKSPHCPQNSDHGGLPAKSAEEHILSFLWYAANKACIRDVAGRFEVAESTHHRMMGRVTAFLLDIAPNVIKFPSDLQKLAVDLRSALISVKNNCMCARRAVPTRGFVSGFEDCVLFSSVVLAGDNTAGDSGEALNVAPEASRSTSGSMLSSMLSIFFHLVVKRHRGG